MTDAIAELIKLAGVGLIAGLFSSVLATRDHRQRKWWELRVAAYQNAIEALSDLVYYYDKHYTAETQYRELTQESTDELNVYWKQAFPKVRKYADSGAFLFSAEANAALQDLMVADNEETYIDHLETNLAKARSCLTRLIDCSKVDLKLKTSLLDRVL